MKKKFMLIATTLLILSLCLYGCDDNQIAEDNTSVNEGKGQQEITTEIEIEETNEVVDEIDDEVTAEVETQEEIVYNITCEPLPVIIDAKPGESVFQIDDFIIRPGVDQSLGDFVESFPDGYIISEKIDKEKPASKNISLKIYRESEDFANQICEVTCLGGDSDKEIPIGNRLMYRISFNELYSGRIYLPGGISAKNIDGSENNIFTSDENVRNTFNEMGMVEQADCYSFSSGFVPGKELFCGYAFYNEDLGPGGFGVDIIGTSGDVFALEKNGDGEVLKEKYGYYRAQGSGNYNTGEYRLMITWNTEEIEN